ncbi:hypothetical protein ACFTAO_00790 [Paenibacillus rhizoplanae]
MSEVQPDEHKIFELLQALHKEIGPKFERCAGMTPTRFRLLQELYRISEISQISLQKASGNRPSSGYPPLKRA